MNCLNRPELLYRLVGWTLLNFVVNSQRGNNFKHFGSLQLPSSDSVNNGEQGKTYTFSVHGGIIQQMIS